MANVSDNYKFNDCDTLNKFCNLLSDASLSPLGKDQIRLKNGEDVVIDVAKEKFEALKGGLSNLSDPSVNQTHTLPVNQTHTLLGRLLNEIDQAYRMKYVHFAASNKTFEELFKNFQEKESEVARLSAFYLIKCNKQREFKENLEKHLSSMSPQDLSVQIVNFHITNCKAYVWLDNFPPCKLIDSMDGYMKIVFQEMKQRILKGECQPSEVFSLVKDESIFSAFMGSFSKEDINKLSSEQLIQFLTPFKQKLLHGGMKKSMEPFFELLGERTPLFSEVERQMAIKLLTSTNDQAPWNIYDKDGRKISAVISLMKPILNIS